MVTNRDRKSFGLNRYAWKRMKNVKGDSRLSNFWKIFGAIQMISCRDWRPWTKPGYITMSKSSWMMDPTRSREMPSCSAIDLAKIRWSSKISSWIWSIISGLVAVLVLPGRGASHVERSPHLNWTTQFLTVACNGACSPNVFVWMALISFGALPCRKKIDYSSRLEVVEMVRVAWRASFQPLEQEKTFKSAHEQTPIELRGNYVE